MKPWQDSCCLSHIEHKSSISIEDCNLRTTMNNELWELGYVRPPVARGLNSSDRLLRCLVTLTPFLYFFFFLLCYRHFRLPEFAFISSLSTEYLRAVAAHIAFFRRICHCWARHNGDVSGIGVSCWESPLHCMIPGLVQQPFLISPAWLWYRALKFVGNEGPHLPCALTKVSEYFFFQLISTLVIMDSSKTADRLLWVGIVECASVSTLGPPIPFPLTEKDMRGCRVRTTEGAGIVDTVSGGCGHVVVIDMGIPLHTGEHKPFSLCNYNSLSGWKDHV